MHRSLMKSMKTIGLLVNCKLCTVETSHFAGSNDCIAGRRANVVSVL